MRTLLRTWLKPAVVGGCLGLALGMGTVRVQAYPPAPHHEFYGVIRDALGNPIDTPAAVVILESASGTAVPGTVVSGRPDGLNYFLTVPMDAGLTSDLYRPTALRPTVPFKIRVQIGRTTYLPMEMSGDYAKLGQPGQRTRLDLTLGEDSDGDGLPDAWELALIAQLARALGLEDVRPEDDLDGDGLSNLSEYLAGTYAYDPEQGFSLEAVGAGAEGPVLEFLAVAGRTYGIEAAVEAQGPWAKAGFRVAGGATVVQGYAAKDARRMQVEVPPAAGREPSQARFFRLVVH